MVRADLAKDPSQVAAMFDDVAGRYDRTNTLLSLGQDGRWRRHVVRALRPHPGERVLDLAAGTGVSTAELARSGAWCVAADFSLGMLRAGAARQVPKVAADAMALPFADAVFDAATISFGLRNVVDPRGALTELARVTKPGGQLLVCEFSTPPFAPMRWGYRWYLKHVLPLIARRFASNPEAYTYLADSINAWPDQRSLAAIIATTGWRDVIWRNMTFGAVALHHAIRV
ncbi:MAG: bifunctional demethylmenaquinone methyltransferase/2-methoxy-6-polyprenyl-1,4-benzoquinol methylase [Actinobacteria bacterium 69-20]|nr:demethylmenaquinone methyltransferase [Actinomycetota bacterium]OJV26646.1 MAG: bifunctional demethylmenaquinone methyltransferase/2-methoxy-6-polyprenyl-1,4-benzoquinol methylase [Actinobacteria bacterium 69-20]